MMRLEPGEETKYRLSIQSVTPLARMHTAGLLRDTPLWGGKNSLPIIRMTYTQLTMRLTYVCNIW
jgi:hypothetical protein